MKLQEKVEALIASCNESNGTIYNRRHENPDSYSHAICNKSPLPEDVAKPTATDEEKQNSSAANNTNNKRKKSTKAAAVKAPKLTTQNRFELLSETNDFQLPETSTSELDSEAGKEVTDMEVNSSPPVTLSCPNFAQPTSTAAYTQNKVSR